MKALLMFALLLPLNVYATDCTEWANFTKIITYRFRDAGLSQPDVEAELTKTMSEHPELPLAIEWITYAYNNPNITAQNIWLGVYNQCLSK